MAVFYPRGSIIARMKPKLPWLPVEVGSGQATDVCPRCGKKKLVPWTLRRDVRTVMPVRTWLCLDCQATVERPEPE
jgi:transposase